MDINKSGYILPWRLSIMKTKEKECIALKRNGAAYVLKLLSGKSEQDELEFWATRTKRLRMLNSGK